MKELDLDPFAPKIELSEETDNSKRMTEQVLFNIRYQAEYERFLVRKADYKDGMRKAYALI